MLADRIRILRRQVGDSQESFVEKCGVSRVTVPRWEAGERVPDADALRAMSDAYDVTSDWLLERIDNPYLILRKKQLTIQNKPLHNVTMFYAVQS